MSIIAFWWFVAGMIGILLYNWLILINNREFTAGNLATSCLIWLSGPIGLVIWLIIVVTMHRHKVIFRNPK